MTKEMHVRTAFAVTAMAAIVMVSVNVARAADPPKADLTVWTPPEIGSVGRVHSASSSNTAMR